MPFFIYGRDSHSGETVKRIFSDAPTEADARAEAAARGVEVTSVVMAREDQRPSEPASSEGTQATATTSSPKHVPVMNDVQRDVIAGIARYMRITSIMLLIVSTVQLGLAVFGRNTLFGIQGAMSLIVGALTLRAGNRFGRVSKTRDGNQGLLTEALEGLRSLYWFQTLVIAAVGIMLVGLALWASWQYREYSTRVTVSEGVLAGNKVQTQIVEFYLDEKRCPTSGEGGIGAPASYASAQVRTIALATLDDGKCSIMITYNNGKYITRSWDGKELEGKNPKFNWSVATDWPESVLPTSLAAAMAAGK